MTASGPASSAYIKAAADIVLRIHEDEDEVDGHILVFLTGQDEIEKCCAMIREALEEREGRRERPSLMVLPLYAALASDVQKSVFRKVEGGVRKVVVATNIAETSVTVPHVRYVVDTGYVKQKVYDPSRHMESLVVVPISQVSAEQRAGRAGRTASGKCYRLYSSDCLSMMTRETVPEIQRSNLANVILQLKALGILDVMGFDFLDPPSPDLLAEGLISLHMLGGLDDEGRLTPVGRSMSVFSVEPALSRIIIRSAEMDEHCLDDAIIVAAMLSVEDFWVRKNRSHRDQEGGHGGRRDEGRDRDTANEAEEAHARLRHPLGDHHTYLQVFRRWEEAGGSVDWCFEHFVRHRSLRMANQIRAQLWDEAVSANIADRSMKPATVSSSRQEGRRHDNRPAPSPSPSFDKGAQRERRERERRLSLALAAGLFMNLARRCTNETIFRTVPLVKPDDPSHRGHSFRDYFDTDVRLLHLHPTCSLGTATSGGGGAGAGGVPELVLYQDVVVGAKPAMRHVMAADAVATESTRLRDSWRFVLPCLLSGRDVVAVASDSPGPGDNRSLDGVGDGRKRGAGGGGDDGDGLLDRGTAISAAKDRYAARKKVR